MKLFRCGGCGASISGQGKYGLCRKCAYKRRPRTASGEKIETIRASVLAGIKENMKTYGIRLKCRRCELDCKQIRVPGSRILFCPKITEGRPAHV
jgi:hypothetical protein